MRISLDRLEWISLLWFLLCWIGYARFSGFRKRQSPRLQDALLLHIRNWIDVLFQRENRITDTSVIASIERNAAFFASSSLLIIAALITAASSGEHLVGFISDLPFMQRIDRQAWELGILMLLVIFAYAFFTFTWCMRQWGFVAILVGSTPLPSDSTADAAREIQREALTSMVWLAIYHFNLGLRAYYFSLALLGWFVHPLVFMLASTWVVGVLYRREFHSRTLKALLPPG